MSNELPEVLRQDDPALRPDDIGWATGEKVIVGKYRTWWPEAEARSMTAQWAGLLGGEPAWAGWLNQAEATAFLPDGTKVLVIAVASRTGQPEPEASRG